MKTLRILFFVCFSALLSFPTSTNAQTLAMCTSPKGKAFFPYMGVIDQKGSGWRDDEISSGFYTLKRLPNGQFDLLFLDASQQIHSATQDGGTVILVRRGKNDMTFVVSYAGYTLEVYTFLRDLAGQAWFTVLASRGGDRISIPKSSLLVGSCSVVALNW